MDLLFRRNCQTSSSYCPETQASDFKISPNPVTNQEITVKGDIQKVKKAEIYNLQGKVMQTIDQPFRTEIQ
jgi:hypothetical protein